MFVGNPRSHPSRICTPLPWCALAIVAIRAPAQSLPELAIHAEAVLDGSANHLGPDALFSAGPDGRLIVMRSDTTVFLFTSAGTHPVVLPMPRDTLGRAVPMLRHAMWNTVMGWAADSPWVRFEDHAEVYTPDGQAGRSIDLVMTVTASPRSPMISHTANFFARAPLIAVRPGGGLLLAEFVDRRWTDPTIAMGTAVVLAVSDRGRFDQWITATPSGGEGCRPPVRFSSATDPIIPFCRLMGGTVSPGGARLAFVERASSAPDASSHPLRLVTLAADGDTLENALLQLPAVPVTPAEEDSAINVQRKLNRGWKSVDSIVRTLKRLAVSTHAPADRILVGNSGWVWLQLFSRDSTHHWALVDPHGSINGAVTVPANVELRTIAGDTAWGLRVADSTVADIVRYEVHH
jgi:hypothetical protein